MQHLEQVRRTEHDGCDQVTNVFMSFDLVPGGLDMEGLKAAQAEEDARLATGRPLPPQVREQAWNFRLATLAFGGRDATKLKYQIWTDGCHDIGGSLETCNAPGGRATGELRLGEHTPAGFKATPRPDGVTGVTFNPMVPSLQIGASCWAGDNLFPNKATCFNSGRYSGGSDLKNTAYCGLGLVIVPAPVCNRSANSAWDFCVPPTTCFETTNATQRQQCATNPGKFAVLPFEGNQEHRFPAREGEVLTKISWKVCCGCGQAPPAPEVPPPPPPPRVPKPDCDPQKYWDDYTRKWNTSQQLFEQAQKDMQSASKEFSDWEKEEGKVMVEIAAEKYDLLQTVQLALEEAATHLLHKLVGYFGMATTAAWIYTDVYPHVRTHDQEMENAAKEVDAAVALGNEAIADLKSQLSQNANCKDQWAKADAEAKAKETLLDQAKQLRDEWQLEGSPLYKDPNDPNGYPLDARAALQRAIDILSKPGTQQGSHSSNSRPSDRATLLDVNFLLPATDASSSDDGPVHMVSVEQLRAALKEVQSAESMMINGRAMMEKQKTFENKWGQQLGVLTGQQKHATAARAAR
jgi:hypothetical protein